MSGMLRSAAPHPALQRRSSCQAGSTMLEVLAALALLAVAILPLASATLAALDRRERLEEKLTQHQSGLRGRVEQDESGLLWSWGVRPGLLSWTSEPGLSVRLEGRGSERCDFIGLWVDGWFQGEWAATGAETVKVGQPAFWRGRAGREVVVRGRQPGGPWGAPLRAVVPGGDRRQETGSSEALVHLPWAGTGKVSVSGSTAPSLPQEGPLLLTELPAGDISSGYFKQEQHWFGTRGRFVHVFF